MMFENHFKLFWVVIILGIFSLLLSGCTTLDLEQFTISEILDRDSDPITTSLDDAQYEVLWLDDFRPVETKSLFELPQGPGGGFLLQSGVYEGRVQSYCLKAGTYAPGEGEGYIYAPLRGNQADIVGSILRNSADHPEISQRDIQKLIWTIQSRAKIEDLPHREQVLAARLLSVEQILMINRNALDIIPASLRERAMGQLPQSAYRALEAENHIRELLSSAETTYDQLERAAFLTGIVPWGEGSRQVPAGRWSYHPDGYYIKYNLSGYTTAEVTVFKPRRITIERDHLNRISALADEYGNRLETDYDDTARPLIVPGDERIIGYRFSKIRFIRVDPDNTGKFEELEMDLDGWTYVGVPGGGGQFPWEESIRFSFLNRLQQLFAVKASGGEDIYDYYYETFKGAYGSYQEAVEMRDYVRDRAGPHSPEVIDDLVDIDRYNDGIQKATNIKDIKGRGDWIRDHLNIVVDAWIYCSDKIAGLLDRGRGDETPEVDLTDGVAVPGNTSRQRIGLSSRPSD